MEGVRKFIEGMFQIDNKVVGYSSDGVNYDYGNGKILKVNITSIFPFTLGSDKPRKREKALYYSISTPTGHAGSGYIVISNLEYEYCLEQLKKKVEEQTLEVGKFLTHDR